MGLCSAGTRPLWSRLTADASPNAGPAWSSGLIAGALLGYLLVLFMGQGDEEILVLLLMGWLLVVYFACAVLRYEPAACVYGAAFAALVVHLVGAGGIGMPGITQMLLWLVVLGGGDRLADAGRDVTVTRSWHEQRRCYSDQPLFLGCLVTGLMRSGPAAHKWRRRRALWQRQPAGGRRRKVSTRGRNASPAVPWEKLSALAYERWLMADSNRPDDFEHSVDWQRQAIARDPRNSGGYRTLADLYLGHFKRTGQPADASAAVDAMLQAISLYPNQAVAQSQLAESLALAGRTDEACEVARRALELDASNERAGHIDKRLPKERAKLMDAILASGRKTTKSADY